MEIDNSQEIYIDSDFIHEFGKMKNTAVNGEYLEEIGGIVLNFSLLEYELYVLVHGLLHTDVQVSRIVTCELSFRAMIDLSYSLIRQAYGEIVAREYKKVLRFVNEADKRRNLVAHSIWGSTNNYIIRTKTTAKSKNGLMTNHEKYRLEDLSSIRETISEAIFAVEYFRKQLGYEWI